MAKQRRSLSIPRLVVIGAGEMACLYHLPSLQYLVNKKRCELAAICDVRRDAAANAARTFGAAAVYDDAGTMLDAEKPDGVLVFVPPAVTVGVASMVMRLGYPVMLEKPPGETERECLKLARAAEESRARHMVAFNRRFCPVLSAGKREIDQRGGAKGGSARMLRKGRTDPSFFTGTAIHSLDALRYLAGDIDAVQLVRRTLPGDARPTFSLLLDYASGGTGVLEVRPEAGAQVERYELYGHDAVALIEAGVGWLVDKPGRVSVYDQNQPVKMPDPLKAYRKWTGHLYEAACGGFFQENEAFVNALHTGGEMHPTVDETVESVAIAQAAQEGRSWRRRRMR